VFVDSNTKCASTIKANLARLKIKDNVTILRLDAIKSIKKLARNKRYFELVFLDPPYYKGLVEKTLIALDEYAIIRTSGFAIAEHSGKDKVPEVISNLKLVRQSAYGDTIVSFYKTLQDKRLGD